MAYITFEELVTRYPSMDKWANMDSEVSSDLIYYAEIELHGRLGTHFSVPFSGSHPTVKDIAIDLAYYRALWRTDQERAERLHKRVIQRIEDINNGKEFIYTGSGTVLPPSVTPEGVDIWSSVMDYHPVHSILGPENVYTAVDSSQLDYEESLRD